MSRELYLSGIAEVLEVDSTLFNVPGTSLLTTADRRTDQHVSHYHLGAHSVLWTGSDLAPRLHDWHGRTTQTSFAELEKWAVAEGATPMGLGLDHVLVDEFQNRPRSPQIVDLGDKGSATVELAKVLFESCSEEDVDDAEFELDDLDPFLTGWLEDGRLLALAGSRPFEMRPHFHDTGVLVHPLARRRGLGTDVVGALTTALLAAGEHPAYRCSIDNIASRQIALNLGYTEVVRLHALTWNPDHT